MRPTETARIEEPPQLVPDVITLRRERPQGALSPTSTDRLMDAYLELEPYDLYVTSRSVLGYADGSRFLDVLTQPGPELSDPPIAIED
jgi:hypothetical protein